LEDTLAIWRRLMVFPWHVKFLDPDDMADQYCWDTDRAAEGVWLLRQREFAVQQNPSFFG